MDTLKRRQAILEILCYRKHETMENLAAELGVSIRTIQRDVHDLSEDHPVWVSCGRYGGGVYIQKDYHLRIVELNNQERCVLKRVAGRLSGQDRKTILRLLNGASHRY